MARVLLIVFVLAVAFWVVSAVDCVAQPRTRHRGVSKTAWVLIVILLPVVGGILWFTIGRGRRGKAAAPATAPDDDPRFLNSIGSISDQDERIRRLEEELAQLDAEAEDPPAPSSGAENTDGDDPHDPQRGQG